MICLSGRGAGSSSNSNPRQRFLQNIYPPITPGALNSIATSKGKAIAYGISIHAIIPHLMSILLFLKSLRSATQRQNQSSDRAIERSPARKRLSLLSLVSPVSFPSYHSKTSPFGYVAALHAHIGDTTSDSSSTRPNPINPRRPLPGTDLVCIREATGSSVRSICGGNDTASDRHLNDNRGISR